MKYNPAWLLVAWSMACSAGPAPRSALQKLAVSSNGRFLVRQDGSPFFWMADTAWFLPKLSRADVSLYLSDRAAKGFNVIQIDLNTYGWHAYTGWIGGKTPPLGLQPFMNGNPDTPNDTYWQFIDWVVGEAEDRTLYVALTISWACFYPELFAADTQKAFRLGRWLGRRYGLRSNVLWIVAGEDNSINNYGGTLTPAQKALFDAVARGLDAGHGGSQLATIHPTVPYRSSSEHFHAASWLDFNMLQSGHVSDSEAFGEQPNHALIAKDYARTPSKPVVDGESLYEGKPDGYFIRKDPNRPRAGADAIRRKAYWEVFAGAFGHTYGHNDVMVFTVPGEPAFNSSHRSGWKDVLDAEGADDMRHLRALMESRSFLDRIPDQSLPASGAGEGNNHVRATRASDGRWAFVYVPTGGAVTLDMGKISGAGVRASWYDPRNGSLTSIGDFPNRGTRSFDAPGATAVGNDWVLVLDSTRSPTELGVQDTQFTINGKPTFLLGVSYYAGLGASEDALKRDLDDMQKYGFNWLRVWATWGAFQGDVSAVDASGRPREAFLARLKALVAECDRRGMVVDVTLSRENGLTGPPRFQTLETHRPAVETVVLALKGHRNWYLDVSNERNLKGKVHASFVDVKQLCDAVRRLDKTLLLTASHGGDITRHDLREYLAAGVAFISPHRERNAASPGQTAAKTREYLSWMKEAGRSVPVHYQEPFRRGFGRWNPKAEDFGVDLEGARQSGAAGWCFHNGDERAQPDGRPRRSFDLREKRLFEQLDEEEQKFLRTLKP